MTITEALKAGKTILGPSGQEMDYRGIINYPVSGKRHIFVGYHCQSPTTQFICFVDEQGQGYDPDGAKLKNSSVTIKKEKKTVWINMYQVHNGGIRASRVAYGNEKTAISFVDESIDAANYIGTYQVEIEI